MRLFSDDGSIEVTLFLGIIKHLGVGLNPPDTVAICNDHGTDTCNWGPRKKGRI